MMLGGGKGGVFQKIGSFAGVRGGLEVGRLRRAEEVWRAFILKEEKHAADEDNWFDEDLEYENCFLERAT